MDQRQLSPRDVTIVLLPGMDGTGTLFEPFLKVTSPSFSTRVVRYPTNRPLTYDQLTALVREQGPADRPVVLVAESYSGPVALKYALAYPEQVRAVVLCAGFVRNPLPHWIGRVAHPLLLRFRVPRAGIRLALLGWKAPRRLVRSVQNAIRSVSPAVLVHRVHQVLELDCGEALARCPVPILYLQGDRDRLVRGASVQRLLSSGAGLQRRIVPGPHLLLQAAPAAAWREIEWFLQRCGIVEASGLKEAPDRSRQTAARPVEERNSRRARAWRGRGMVSSSA